MDVKTPIQQASRQVIAARHAHGLRMRARQRQLAPERAIDSVIADLEELQLVGQRRVPESYATRLRELAELLPAPVPDLPTGVRITQLMDVLYGQQERLLAARRRDLAAYPADVEDEAPKAP